MRKADIIGGLMGVFISAFVFYESSKFPEDIVMKIGPSYFPRILAMGLLLVSGILILQAYMGKSKKPAEKFDIKEPGIQRAGIALLSTIVYCMILDKVGFIPSSILYLVFLMYLLEKRNYVKMTMISTAVVVGIYIIFKTILNITLPSGFFG
ncbi:Tripartite tricarboxylate transporter TctB family protein [Geosporobacter subterraneus DSM 17957]|uniref:Tripartite tricarboxylate transporter TctB family protein n=1 Tax=Geosporobacter subterraneus DSM 17957 TaxID=1121919 RepID=A0A1M6EQ93_9FIRM|nr:tripartite tricarboxylate transporter TctB family protein [Geosporobacter subterraneus]SHI87644.1 Tripartite tricarboxylate transporter TctB family protein [Geosporobacter subterraneus DSM 17957]